MRARSAVLGLIASGLLGLRAEAADLSAESAALVHDILAPQRAGAAAPAGVDPAAYAQAIEILRRERLLEAGRPPTGLSRVIDVLAGPLMLGSRGRAQPAEVGAVRDALVRGDDPGAKAAIQKLYAAMGRKPPEGKPLDDLHAAAAKALGDAPAESERFEIQRPDYVVSVVNARRAGRAEIEVIAAKGPDGQPARVTFGGDVTARPDASGRNLELAAQPTPVKAKTSLDIAALREKLNGRWIDGEGMVWNVTGGGATITLTALRPGRPPCAYAGEFKLGRITASCPIDRPDRMNSAIPQAIRDQIVGRGLSWRVRLVADDAGARLEGTWTSQHVTYDSGGTKIDRVHSPFDEELVLKRDTRKVAQGGLWPRDGP